MLFWGSSFVWASFAGYLIKYPIQAYSWWYLFEEYRETRPTFKNEDQITEITRKEESTVQTPPMIYTKPSRFSQKPNQSYDINTPTSKYVTKTGKLTPITEGDTSQSGAHSFIDMVRLNANAPLLSPETSELSEKSRKSGRSSKSAKYRNKISENPEYYKNVTGTQYQIPDQTAHSEKPDTSSSFQTSEIPHFSPYVSQQDFQKLLTPVESKSSNTCLGSLSDISTVAPSTRTLQRTTFCGNEARVTISKNRHDTFDEIAEFDDNYMSLDSISPEFDNFKVDQESEREHDDDGNPIGARPSNY